MPGDNRFVTEYFLAQNFTPKSGVTPGSDNTLWMDCDQILARYNVTISGVTSTGKRWPSQNQTTSSIVAPTYIGSTYAYAQIYNPTTISITIPVNANLMIVSIHGINTNRESGTPTYGGITLTQAGNYAGNNPMEMWYLINPSNGTNTLSIPNYPIANLHVVISWYSFNGTFTLQGTAAANGLNANPTTTIATSAGGKKTFIIDAVTLRAYSTYKVRGGTYSDAKIYKGIAGAVAGASSQYASYDSLASSRTLWWTNQDEPLYWYSMIAYFTIE